METDHIRRLHIMSEEDFRALLDDLSDHSRPIKDKLDFAQELTKTGIGRSIYDEPNLSRKLISRKMLATSFCNNNNNDVTDCNNQPNNVNKSMDNDSAVNAAKSAKSMSDLRDNYHHNQQKDQVSPAKSIPVKDRTDKEHPDDDEHPSRRTVMTGNNLHTVSGVRDSYVNNQIDESDPSAGINFFPTPSPNCSSKDCRKAANTCEQSVGASSQPAESYLTNNDNINSSAFSGRNSLRDLEQCVEQISPPSAPIYDSVCRLNRNSVNNSSSNNSAYRRFNRVPDEDDSDKMEFGESHNLEHQSRIFEYHKNHSPVNKDGKSDSLFTTHREPENINTALGRSRKGRKKAPEPVKKAEETPGYVGYAIDINLLDSFIRGEKNRQEIKALDGANNGTSPENGQEPKKNKKKLKKKLNRDNRSVSEKNLPVNKQNNSARTGKSSSKPVSSNEASSSEVEDISPPSSSQTLQVSSNKSQSLFLAEYEFVSPTSAELDEYQTVSDPELEREKDFVTPKNKTFKKNKKASPKVPNENASFDSRKGFSKRELKRDRPNTNSTLHNGYESEKDVHAFVPEALNIPMKITARNVIAPTSRVLPIVLDEPDFPNSKNNNARSSSIDGDGQLQQGNIVNGYFPRINNDFVIVEPQAPPPTSGALSYAQIAKNIAAAAAAAAAATTTSASAPSSAPSAGSHAPSTTATPSAIIPATTNNAHKSQKFEKKPRNNSAAANLFPISAKDKNSSLSESQSNPEDSPNTSIETKAIASSPKVVEKPAQDGSPIDNMSAPQPLRVTCSGDNLFTVETVYAQNNTETDSTRFMFGNFDNEEIDSVLQGATFSPLEECFVPKKRAKSVETPRSPTVVPVAGAQRPPSSNDGHNSSSPVINYHHLSTSSPLSSPSNLDSSIISSSFKSNTTGSDSASSGFDQNFNSSNVAEILPVLKPVPLPDLSNATVRLTDTPAYAPSEQRQPTLAPFVSCISQLKNYKYIDPIDKNSFNYYAAVNFVRDSWNEFSRLKTV